MVKEKSDRSESTISHVSWLQWKARILSSLDPRRSVFAVIDVQNDFCSKEGALAQRGSDVGPCAAVAEKIQMVLPRFRSILSGICFFRLVYDPARMSEAQRERLVVDGKPVICAPEGGGTNLFLVTPIPGDIVLVKHRYSAFSNDSFCSLLASRQIGTVIVAGVDTHICVESTVRHGYDLGYRMIVLSDLVATRRSDIARHENSLKLSERYFGIVTTSAELLEIWGAG